MSANMPTAATAAVPSTLPLEPLRFPLWGSRLIEASAGTGKTYTIAALYLRLVLQHGGNPAVMAAIGMFSGYCGTLMTPMAANFNIVPAALLELPDKNAVIKAQVPTGVMLLIVNVFLLYFLMFL